MAHGYGNSSWGDGADGATHALAHGLGWFSIGLGVAEWSRPASLPVSLAWKSGRS